jgi:hypothetical protein
MNRIILVVVLSYLALWIYAICDALYGIY